MVARLLRREERNKLSVMKEKARISDLHLKFAEKTWNDTFQLVRRCMEKARDASKPCEPLVRSLERLQEVFNVSSMNTTRCRLEMTAKQQGMGFHITESTCYLTADLFYLEVLLLPCGGVEEVKVAKHGEPPVPSVSLLQLLRSKNFAEFSQKLGGLFAQYNIPGDNEIKLKLLASLQHLEKDLQQLSHLPRAPKYDDPQMETINNGRIGHLTAGKEDCPLTVQFFTPPPDAIKSSDSLVQAAQVTVGDSDVTHRLQMASVIQQPPQLDPQGFPVFAPLAEVPSETLPACFLFKLQPPIPTMTSFIKELNQITHVAVPDVDLQWAPLPKLLMRGSQSPDSHWEASDKKETVFTVSLPGGEMHSYVLPGAAWDAAAQRGALVESVPFTQPAHVPALLELLRHQCVINTLLRSCFNLESSRLSSVCDLHFEVLPESDTSFSVTFRRPDADSLAVLLVNVSNAHEISCSLFGGRTCDPSMDEYISTVMKQCMSVPVTMKTLHSKLQEITSAPLFPSLPATTEAQNDQSGSSNAAAADANSDSVTFCQSAAVSEDTGLSVSGSACCAASVAKSEPHPETNTSPTDSPYLLPPVVVFPPCVGSNGQPPELM
ncbi:mediator of RNA polymerase II transcription subunit 1 isoform X2 [Mugil cephalus]|uniref:mediator of RNA polymerase II transcription subunit 1 isoform X2 n=1 Tax=Mugil cephalus TaxID=48193 RepID=UPI001FB59EEA|nr:mediator of RNA polymerase II transcription subunit 1 isoform X2 [Mugil cephalus]